MYMVFLRQVLSDKIWMGSKGSLLTEGFFVVELTGVEVSTWGFPLFRVFNLHTSFFKEGRCSLGVVSYAPKFESLQHFFQELCHAIVETRMEGEPNDDASQPGRSLGRRGRKGSGRSYQWNERRQNWWDRGLRWFVRAYFSPFVSELHHSISSHISTYLQSNKIELATNNAHQVSMDPKLSMDLRQFSCWQQILSS